MKNVKMLTKLSWCFIIFMSSLCAFKTVRASDSLELPLVVDDLPSESTDLENSQNQDLVLTPGLTKRLLIHLKGSSEEISNEFLSDSLDSYTYKVSTTINEKVETSTFLEFSQPEILTVQLDYQAKECLISGDKGFSVTNPLNEDYYELVVTQEKIPELKKEQLLTSHHKNSEGSKTVIIVSAIGSTFGLVVILYTLKVAVTKISSHAKEEILPAKCTDDQMAFNNIETTAPYSLRAPEPEGCEHENEMALVEQTGCLATCETECNHIHKVENTGWIDDSKDKQIFRSRRQSKLIEVALDMNFGEGGEGREEGEGRDVGRRIPTLSEIKALMRQMEEEGQVNNDYDPSEDTDEEDQYEAPAIPNYFCCLLCFEGKRCTIVEPCRHIFACESCVKQLLETYKVCLLCPKVVTSYEPL